MTLKPPEELYSNYSAGTIGESRWWENKKEITAIILHSS